MAEMGYNVAKAELLRADIDLESATIGALLFSGTVTDDPDLDTVAAVLGVNTEVSHGSYSRQTLASKTVTEDDANNRANFDAAPIDFGALTGVTPTGILFFLDVGGADSSRVPISHHTTGFGVAANGAGYTVPTPNDILRLV